ncbi:DUF1415 domain-containing protein [Agarivorans gilvus]|uniref:DUF1415 domain-containing protein n=1 Tax=Agarivorans gilvus TaxID=680279 RepID=A0ABQ1I6U3_9ALTE|nr:DUF1415 domain-containing protein [Agarivorans gilvus]GGB19913.1 DUF1415 domain-containing protein [Agarivorans gilvus]
MAERQVKLAAEYQEATARWVKDFVVEYNICPFAKRELERGSIYYQVVMGTQPEALLQSLLLECLRLDEHAEIETSLVILPELEDFEDYLDVLDWAEQLLQQQGYEGVYQLASFHPNYCFAGASPNDVSNYTNRAPYATLHLIREQTISRLTALHPDPESIPERNIALTEKLGISSLKQLLAACKG